jgi:anti-anti-sigma factor
MLDVTKQGEVLWVEGEVDMSSADELHAAIRDHGNGPLILDASNVEFMDSSGLKVLIEAGASRNGSIVLRRPSRAIRRLLEIAVPDGIDELQVQE